MPLPLGTILKAALIAGVAAGMTTAVFHLAFTEPLIDRAIALEEAAHASSAGHEEPLVSRDAQRKGLVVGFVLLGIAWAVAFSVAFRAVQRFLPASSRFKQGIALASLAYWAVALLPSLKYPANPPGIGDPDTIGYRQTLYAGFLVLSIGAVIIGPWLAQKLARSPSGVEGVSWMSWGFVVALSLIIFLAMPSISEEGNLPMDLLGSFRLASLLGLTLFWAVLGGLFGKLIGGVRPNPA